MFSIIKFAKVCISNRRNKIQDKSSSVESCLTEDDDTVIYTEKHFEPLNKFEKRFQMALLILVALSVLFILLFSFILFIFKWEYTHNPSDPGAKSENCPMANITVIIFAVLLVLAYIGILAIKGYSSYVISRIWAKDYKDIYRNLKKRYLLSICATFSISLLVLAAIVLIILTTRIREIYVFFDSKLDRYSTLQIILGALLWPIPSNYLMIIVSSVNIHTISYMDIAKEILNKLPEKLEFNPSTLLNLKISKTKDQFTKDNLNDSYDNTKIQRPSHEDPEKQPKINNSSLSEASEENLTESQRANKDQMLFQGRIKKIESDPELDNM